MIDKKQKLLRDQLCNSKAIRSNNASSHLKKSVHMFLRVLAPSSKLMLSPPTLSVGVY